MSGCIGRICPIGTPDSPPRVLCCRPAALFQPGTQRRDAVRLGGRYREPDMSTRRPKVHLGRLLTRGLENELTLSPGDAGLPERVGPVP